MGKENWLPAVAKCRRPLAHVVIMDINILHEYTEVFMSMVFKSAPIDFEPDNDPQSTSFMYSRPSQ